MNIDKLMKLTRDDIETLLVFLDMEIDVWETSGSYVEYEMTEKSYEESKKLFKKLKEIIK